MKRLFGLLVLAAFLAGCATVEYSNVDGRHMVNISNSGWYLFNFIPIASGNPEKVNANSCCLFSDTTTLGNNIDILENIMAKSGAKGVNSIKSYWSDECFLVIFLKRYVIHTSVELTYGADAKYKKQ